MTSVVYLIEQLLIWLTHLMDSLPHPAVLSGSPDTPRAAILAKGEGICAY